MTFPGPAALGRGVVVTPGKEVPFDWPRVRVDQVAADVAGVLHEHWLRRRPVVVELAVDADELRAPERDGREPWQVPVDFEFARERLQFLVWRNNWDWRGDEPVWWWARKAARVGSAALGGPADVVLESGVPAWVDGGPRQRVGAGIGAGVAVVHCESVEAGSLRTAPAGVDAPETAEGLAPDQWAAVAHDVGPARVIAPAGSGKTRVLTARLRHLLADRQWEPGAVAAYAYNKRAADEMVERTEGLPADIRTLNSLGLRMVRGRQTIEEPDVRRLLDQLVTLPRAMNTDPYMPYLEGLRAIRLGLEDPAVVERETGAEGLAELFPRYRRLLADKGVVDFDGQLYEALAAALADPSARSGSRHLLVDEFQDLTPVHLVLLRLLSAPAYDVFGVGDDDQVIYGFGGASPEFLLQFGRFFPGATEYALEVNYRCPPPVIEAAGHLLSYNRRRIAKAVRPGPAAAGTFEVRTLPGVDEAEAVAGLVTAWHGDGQSFGDMAVLARVNAALLPIQILLTERGVPSRRPIDASVLGRTGIRTALAYLRIGLDPGRIAAADVVETIRRPSRRIARNVVEMLTRRGSTSVADIRRLASRLDGGDGSKLAGYEADLQRVAAAVEQGGAAAALRTVRVDLGLGGAMDTLDSARREADRSTHADDLLALEQVAALHPDVATFEPWLRDMLSRRADPMADPMAERGVELTTIHRVKGREWDDVIVFGLSEGLLPHRLASDETEERRLLHVAITRGRERVVVLADEDAPSPFLLELSGTRPRVIHRISTGRGPVENGDKPSGSSTSAGSAGAKVVEALKTWRTDTARRASVPAYVVLNDADIDGIAVRLPRTLADLAQCRGIGPVKLERFGDEILAVIDGATT